jgi:putative hydrolase
MRLLADLHTHTVASGHAYSTVGELARSAATTGLELIAITDHGPSVPGGAHPWHFWNLKALPSVMDGVRILKGVEANLSPTSDNGLDLPDEILAMLDIVSVGMHPECGFDDRDIARNTEAMLCAIANPLVDVITHPGNAEEFPLDRETIVGAATAYGVILELNDHSFHPSSARAASVRQEREFAEAAQHAGAWVAIGSDAHFHAHVGRFDTALAVAEEIGLAPERIVNRNAASVLSHLLARRVRPRLDAGGEWSSW